MFMTAPGAPVPVRTILATIGFVLLTYVAVLAVMKVERVIVWLVVSLFLATALWPLVGLIERHARIPRSVAVLTVFLIGGLLLAVVIALLVAPIVTQGKEFADQLPTYVDQAKQGKGPVGDLVKRFHIDTYVTTHQEQLKQQALGLGTSATHVLGVVASTLAAILSIVVMTFLILLEGPRMLAGALGTLDDDRRERVERVGRDCARSVTGYIAGNLLISVICGTLTYITLLVTGVPYAGVIAVFVAITDLLPLIGATIGAILGVGVAFLHSVTAGVIAIIFFVVYQQVENHLLQPVVLSRTVKINPLVVLVSILFGVELAGILGALLAIPVAGIVQVVIRDVHASRQRPQPS
ncbi:MAG: putative PurR-regulated permease PerM [Frankiales bacterium]|nr:putative PurR-regulated permease PerM [Frankiales bacterium]